MVLCPHFIDEYFLKIKEILHVYRSQINQHVVFSLISARLVERAVIQMRSCQEIEGLSDNVLQIDHLIAIIQRRIGGFERLLLIMMEENCNSWLIEELFNAYLRHVVCHIRKLKASKKCECISDDAPSSSLILSTVSTMWGQLLEKVDNCIFDVGTSIGFLDQSIYPNKNLLDFINRKIPGVRGKRLLSRVEDTDPKIKTKDMSCNQNPDWFRVLSFGDSKSITNTADFQLLHSETINQNMEMEFNFQKSLSQVSNEVKGLRILSNLDSSSIARFQSMNTTKNSCKVIKIEQTNYVRSDNSNNIVNQKTIATETNYYQHEQHDPEGEDFYIVHEHYYNDEYNISTSPSSTFCQSIQEELLESDLEPCFTSSDFEWDYQDLKSESCFQSVDKGTQTVLETDNSNFRHTKVKGDDSRSKSSRHSFYNKSTSTTSSSSIGCGNTKAINVNMGGKMHASASNKKVVPLHSSKSKSNSPTANTKIPFNSTTKKRLSPSEYIQTIPKN